MIEDVEKACRGWSKRYWQHELLCIFFDRTPSFVGLHAFHGLRVNVLQEAVSRDELAQAEVGIMEKLTDRLHQL